MELFNASAIAAANGSDIYYCISSGSEHSDDETTEVDRALQDALEDDSNSVTVRRNSATDSDLDINSELFNLQRQLTPTEDDQHNNNNNKNDSDSYETDLSQHQSRPTSVTVRSSTPTTDATRRPTATGRRATTNSRTDRSRSRGRGRTTTAQRRTIRDSVIWSEVAQAFQPINSQRPVVTVDSNISDDADALVDP